jgi:hypothetical protein
MIGLIGVRVEERCECPCLCFSFFLFWWFVCFRRVYSLGLCFFFVLSNLYRECRVGKRRLKKHSLMKMTSSQNFH